ncbi:hypothetical protein [Bradyrhizobium sp. CCBAU 21360]|uniref:hypothetical protein n=1 Tax=Bradyrhizobium sp. CCBAU 21360 TaxID=1325081 RepID=UPI0023059478|nr:hypothetical protein [Bradyrhizobium sp. CCBAU 21360]
MTGDPPGYRKPEKLHDIADLLQGYDPSDTLPFVKSRDFGTYRLYISDGAATPASLKFRLGKAEHDARLAEG